MRAREHESMGASEHESTRARMKAEMKYHTARRMAIRILRVMDAYTLLEFEFWRGLSHDPRYIIQFLRCSRGIRKPTRHNHKYFTSDGGYLGALGRVFGASLGALGGVLGTLGGQDPSIFTIDKALGGHKPSIFTIDCGPGDVLGRLRRSSGERSSIH